MSTASFKASLLGLANRRIHPLRPIQRLAAWIMTNVLDWASSFDTPEPVSQDLLDDMHRRARDPDLLHPFKVDQRFDLF
jgi:hypothetical protein